MDESKRRLTQRKYRLPYHWIRDPLHKYSVPYFGYLKIVLDELPSPPVTVLDAGCGDGRIAAEMVRTGYDVIGLDYLDISIQYARTLVPEGAFLAGDLRKDLVNNYGMQEGQFDAVVMVEVYEHIPPADCPSVLANIAKVLDENGMLIISVPSNSLPVSKLHYRHFEQEQLEQELAAAGFRVDRVIYQHDMGRLTNWLLGEDVDRFLSNRWLQPVFLKRLRRYIYMRFSNVTDNQASCGRFVARATKQRI